MLNLTCSDWIQKNWYIRGKKIDFFNKKDPYFYRPFLFEIYNDFHEEVAIMKGRQVGASEVMIGKITYFALTIPRSVCVYAFPTSGKAYEFSKMRYEPAINENPILMKERNLDSWGVGIRGFKNRSFILFETAYLPQFGEARAVDYIVFDEYDRMKQESVSAFLESLSSSKYKIRMFVSTPTSENVGIHQKFISGTQSRLYYKCQSCGEWQPILYPDNIDGDWEKWQRAVELLDESIEFRFERICRRCKRPMNLIDCDFQWVDEFPSKKEIHSYKISQLEAVWISATEIMKKRISLRDELLWYNYVLGEPYKFKVYGIEAFEQKLKSLCKGELYLRRTPEFEVISVGIDWGNDNHIVVCGKKSDGKIYVLNAFVNKAREDIFEMIDELANSIKPYKPNIVCADWGYGKDRIALLSKALDKKVYAVRYSSSAYLEYEPDLTGEKGFISVNRTWLLRNIFEHIVSEKVVFPPYLIVGAFINHLSRLDIKRNYEDKQFEFDTKGQDHFIHAFGYALVGLMRQRNVQPEVFTWDLTTNTFEEEKEEVVEQVRQNYTPMRIISQYERGNLNSEEADIFFEVI